MRATLLRLVVRLAAAGRLVATSQAQEPRIGASYHEGEDLGVFEAYTKFNWLQPWAQTEVDALISDVHFILDWDENAAGNIGGGYRAYVPNSDQLFGVYGW